MPFWNKKSDCIKNTGELVYNNLTDKIFDKEKSFNNSNQFSAETIIKLRVLYFKRMMLMLLCRDYPDLFAYEGYKIGVRSLDEYLKSSMKFLNNETIRKEMYVDIERYITMWINDTQPVEQIAGSKKIVRKQTKKTRKSRK